MCLTGLKVLLLASFTQPILRKVRRVHQNPPHLSSSLLLACLPTCLHNPSSHHVASCAHRGIAIAVAAACFADFASTWLQPSALNTLTLLPTTSDRSLRLCTSRAGRFISPSGFSRPRLRR